MLRGRPTSFAYADQPEEPSEVEAGAARRKKGLGMARQRFAVAAAGIASYDPALDADAALEDLPAAGTNLVPLDDPETPVDAGGEADEAAEG